MGKGGVGSTRSEFLPEESVDDIRYHRNGGCFVTTKRAIGFVLFAILALIVVIIMMYYYGPNRKLEQLHDDLKDIDELINKTINEETNENIRLPTSLKPLHYRLRIHPILDEPSPNNFTFTGQVKILVHCHSVTNKIVLNVDDLNVTDSQVRVTTTETTTLRSESLIQEEYVEDDPWNNGTDTVSAGNNKSEIDDTENIDGTNNGTGVVVRFNTVKVLVNEVSKDEDNYKLTIYTGSPLKSGHNYTVEIEFSGQILNNLIGLYKTSYVDLSGRKKWLATTYFQSIFARRVFPCFDEPNFKSTFELIIARRINMTALSNMPLKKSEQMMNTTDWVWDHFEKSLPMSTYLVSFTICDFHNVSAQTRATGPLINVWAPENDLPFTKYALHVSQGILVFFERYFGFKYSLPKIDLITIPNTARNSIGSWGILSFSKSLLLLDEDSFFMDTKQRVFISLAHAISHQWFGNIVTMKWWNDLWLNEGIGSFMAEVVQSELMPKWQTLDNFPYRVMYPSFILDSLQSTRSIQNDVIKTTQIEQIYDTAVQGKGVSLIRMLNHTLTRPVFRQGLESFIKDLSYKSVDQDTLWNALSEIAKNKSVFPSDVNVKTFMNSWTTQRGYPYVTISRDYSTGQANITQQIFIQNNVDSETLWYIPLSFKLAGNNSASKMIWLKNQRYITANLTLPDDQNNSWVLFNLNQAGYFRTNYDTRNWKLLTDQLQQNPSVIPIANRGQLIDDAFELAKMEIINYSIPLELTKYLPDRESNYIPWLAAIQKLDELKDIIDNYEYTGAYENYMLNMIRTRFDQLNNVTNDMEPENHKVFQLVLRQTACDLRYGPCIKWAQHQYAVWMKESRPDDKNPILFDYRFTVQCTAIKFGGNDEWEFLWNRTLSPSISSNDLKIIYLSLGCTNDPWLLNKYLELSLSGNVTLEEVPTIWASLTHPVGIRTGFNFLRLNWKRVYSSYEDIYLILSAICQDFLSRLSTKIDLEDLTRFYKNYQKDFKTVAAVMQGAVDVIKLRISWKEKHLDTIVNWLKSNNY